MSSVPQIGFRTTNTKRYCSHFKPNSNESSSSCLIWTTWHHCISSFFRPTGCKSLSGQVSFIICNGIVFIQPKWCNFSSTGSECHQPAVEMSFLPRVSHRANHQITSDHHLSRLFWKILGAKFKRAGLSVGMLYWQWRPFFKLSFAQVDIAP